VRVRRDRSALLVVDVQPDFCPGGALPVRGGDEILAPIEALMGRGLFGVVVATQDWHPRGHVSFASSHPGRAPMEVLRSGGREQILWPDHCVQGTDGARLHPSLDWRQVSAIIRKGSDPVSDSYSGFRDNWTVAGDRPSTGLAGYLRERGVEDVFVCGLARDVCVKWTAEDAAREGFRAILLWDLTRAVSPDDDERVRGELRAAGVEIVESRALQAEIPE
jgi:nicotinamidase/pyrazinamidase